MIPPPFPFMERDPYNEQWLRDEVIYLHSLWHRGPPPPPPPHHHFLHPPQPPHHHHFFHSLNPPLFKTQRPSKRGRDRTQKLLQLSTSEWPCPPSPPPKSPVWPSFKTTQLPSNAHVHVASPKLQSWASGNRIQQKIIKEVTKFFNTQLDGSDDDDMDDDSGNEEGGENGGYFGFFLKLFEENEELRSFYKKNNEDGEFGCIVCGGVGTIRRFKDCVALVQHTQTILKTKTTKAHRAFGLVVCKVLGWDVNKLPSIISSIAGKKNETLSDLEEDLPHVQEQLSNEAGDVGSGDKESGEKEGDGAEKVPDNCVLAVGEAGPVSIDVGRGVDVCCVSEKGSSSTGYEKLPTPRSDISNLAQVYLDGISIFTKLKENTPDIMQGSINGSLVSLEAGPGSIDVGRDVDVCSVNEKENSSTGDEKLPSTDISNLAQEPERRGTNESEDQ